MREVSPLLEELLNGSREVAWEANVIRGDRSEPNMPVVLDGALTWKAAQMVELAGKIRVPIQDPEGRSWAPRGPGDLFAPFGSEVALLCRVSAGQSFERVQVGRLRIHKVPAVQPDRVRFGGEVRTFAEVITLDLRDRMDVLQRDKFDAPTSVRFPASAWTELEHLSPFPVVRSSVDVALPSDLTFEGNRAEAVQTVAAQLGGVAAFDSTGNLIVRRLSNAPALTLRLGGAGTVTEVGSVMDSEGVYNRVIVRGKRADGVPIQAVREATGDLAPDRWGRRTYTADQGAFLKTQAQADAYATRLLGQVSSTRTTELEVQCQLDPRVELDDVAAVEWHGRAERIRATSIAYGDTMMTVTGDVLR